MYTMNWDDLERLASVLAASRQLVLGLGLTSLSSHCAERRI